jgi:murein DD-endopeptidase MepM/ murein hydrolase activator NlpD
MSELEILRQGTAPKRVNRLERLFPPRQFLVRGSSRTGVLTLSTRLQAGAAATASVLVVGVLAVAIGAAWTHRTADQLAHEKETWRRTAALESARAAADRDRFARLAPELARSLADRDRAAEAADAAGQSLAEKRHDLERLASERAHVALERDRAVAERDAALAANRELLRQLDVETRHTIAEVERIIAATGLDLARATRAVAAPGTAEPQSRPAPRGGPFIRWREEFASLGAPEMRRLDGVAFGLDRLRDLGDFLARLPLASPLPAIDVTSGYGFRLDPFSRFAAMHEGLDMRAASNTEVRATAAGLVQFAGWKAEYGYTVEIDHGFGIVTRYAHLSHIAVREGEPVKLRQALGTIGATGRTTGQHLHYEVRVDGRARNPMNFLRVDRNLAKEVSHVR